LIVNYSEALLDVSDQIRVVSVNPAAQLLAALSLSSGPWRSRLCCCSSVARVSGREFVDGGVSLSLT
jgi:hypothetical protein